MAGSDGVRYEHPLPPPSSAFWKVIAAVFGVVGLIVSYGAGYASGQKNPGPPKSCQIPHAAKATTVTAAQRNVVWRTMNHSDRNNLSVSPEALVGAAVGFLLDPDAQSKSVSEKKEWRNNGFLIYENRLFMYLGKEDAARFEQKLKETLENGTPEQMLAGFRELVAYDALGLELFQSVLADQERLNYFMNGLPIPRE